MPIARMLGGRPKAESGAAGRYRPADGATSVKVQQRWSATTVQARATDEPIRTRNATVADVARPPSAFFSQQFAEQVIFQHALGEQTLEGQGWFSRSSSLRRCASLTVMPPVGFAPAVKGRFGDAMFAADGRPHRLLAYPRPGPGC